MDIAQERLAQFFKTQKRVSYKRGELVFVAQDKVSQAAYLVDGYIKVSTMSENGRGVSHFILGPGSVLPKTLLLKNQRLQHDYQALGKVIVQQAGLEDYYDFIGANSDVEILVVGQNLEIAKKYSSRVNNLSLARSYHRLVDLVLNLALEFGNPESPNRVSIPVPLTHQGIADAINTNRETTTRLLKKLQQDDLIKNEGKRIVVKDVKQLKKELSSLA